MSRNFEGKIHQEIPEGVAINHWLDSASLRKMQGCSDIPFQVVTHPQYQCVEYKIKLNLFTFGKFRWHIPMTVIAPPFSIDSVGYCGDLNSLITDYKKRRGLFLLLNLHCEPQLTAVAAEAAIGETLPTCILDRRFSSWDEYIASLRSSYRRRVKQALSKGAKLEIRRVNSGDFSEALYQLYLQVLHHSRFPLETLKLDFFRRFDGEIYAFFRNEENTINETPLAFVALKRLSFEKDLSFNQETGELMRMGEGSMSAESEKSRDSMKIIADELDFVCGGMDYSRRDEFDLYYNMLLLVLRRAIETQVEQVNFGQTAEAAKQRLGCRLEKRYLVAFSGNSILTRLLRLFAPALSYRDTEERYQVFRTSNEQSSHIGINPFE